MMDRLWTLLRAIGTALCICTSAAAGGSYSPAACPAGTILKYAGAGSVTLNYDQGALGARTKSLADTLVSDAVSVWPAVPTSTVTISRGADLPEDVTLANYAPNYSTNFSDGINPVVYDSDGAIIDNLFGANAKNSVLGFAGSHFVGCVYTEGKAVISGYLALSDTTTKVVFAHEIGHMIGLDHTQIDSEQGLSTSNYPLMYPIAYRNQFSLHEDDVASVSALYPDAVPLAGAYGQLTGTFTQAGGAPILGANLWAKENVSNKVYSVVSDYLRQGTGYFKLVLPAGTYTLHAGAIRTTFVGASSVGPYAATAAGASFQAPMYVGGTPMSALTLGNATPLQITISPGCSATASFKFDGTGSIGGNCVSNYTVSFNSNGGSAVSSQVVASGGTAVAPAAPTKTGSTFVGWYADAGLTMPFNFSTLISGDITLFAKWSINNYTVSFNSNGGTAVADQIVAYNGVALMPANPAKAGSTFAGWYSDAGLNTAFNFSTAITGNLTLYAKWSLNNYTVSFEANGGSAVSSEIIAYGSAAVVPTPPTKLGSAFAGWYSDAGLTIAFNFSTAITGNLTLYAKWTLNTYTVSFDSNGGSTVGSQIVPYLGSAIRPVNPTKKGLRFAGWYSDAGLNTPYNFSTAIAGDTTIYAKWAVPNLTSIFMLLLE